MSIIRTIQNEGTGIDISVPRFQEEEAPLGGVSVLYEIAVLTKLDLFKTRLHRNEDVVQFSVSTSVCYKYAAFSICMCTVM